VSDIKPNKEIGPMRGKGEEVWGFFRLWEDELGNRGNQEAYTFI
jgi:hypothetical protein